MKLTQAKAKELISNIKIAEIVSIKKHEDADKLWIVQISLGSEAEVSPAIQNENGTIQIVTAATNISEGDLVPHLAPGNVVPGWLFKEGEEIRLESRKMRGEISHGMILAADEIGIGEDHDGIYKIQDSTLRQAQNEKEKETLIGKSILEVLGGEELEYVLADLSILEGLRAVTEEIIGEADLLKIIKSKEEVNHYIGFEISGLVHLGQGIMSGLVIRELQKLGIHCRIFLADWHTWINNKLGGDRDLIHKVGHEYFAPAIKIGVQIAGGNPEEVEIIEGSDLYQNNDKYWQTVIDVSKNLTLSRVLKSTTILGREASNSMEFAMLIYPSMQAADIFEMQNHIAHAGTDQRNVHMIAREVAEKMNVAQLHNPIDDKVMKPISIHHGLVPGLQTPAQWPLPKDIDKKAMLTTLKMSKSVPDSAIFITDSEEDIERKIRKAFCPEKEIDYNPVLEWVRMMIFPIVGKFELKREEKFGGDVTFETFEALRSAFEKGDVFPLDLKNNVSRYLIEMLKPAREYFGAEDKQALIKEIQERRSR